jgi:hypothetical protein
MNTAVTETARVLNPLSTSISNGIMRSIDACIAILDARRREKSINDLAYALKLEYPKESEDFVMNMAIQMYGGK